MVSVISEVKQTMAFEESGGVRWLKKAEFIHHMQTMEGRGEEDAASEFDRMIKNPAVKKMTHAGDDMRVPVLKPPETTAIRRREISASVRTATTVESKAQAEAAMASLAEVGDGASALHHPVFHEMSSMLRPGAVAGMSSGQPLLLEKLAPPPAASVVPDDVFLSAAPPVKRALGARISDLGDDLADAASKQKCKKTGGALLAGVTGELRSARERGMTSCKALWANFGKAGQNVAKQFLAEKKTLADSDAVSSDDIAAAKKYEEALAAVRKEETQIKVWTLDNAESGLNRLVNLADELEQLTSHLKPALEKLADIKAAKRKAATSAANEAAKARARLCAPYKGDAPEPMLRFLYEVGALGQQTFSDRIDKVAADESVFGALRLAHFPKKADADSNGVGARVQSVLDKISEQRLQAAEKKQKPV